MCESCCDRSFHFDQRAALLWGSLRRRNLCERASTLFVAASLRALQDRDREGLFPGHSELWSWGWPDDFERAVAV